MSSSPRMHLALDLVGGRALYDESTLDAVLDAFESHGLEPDTWAIGEPPGHDYARDGARRALLGRSATAVGLYRSRAPAYSARVFGRRRPRILVVFDPPPAEQHHPAIIALADALAAAQQPHIGWLHPVADVEPPFDDPVPRIRWHMDQCCDGSVSEYGDHGPGGLGAITWIGPALLDLIGRRRLDAAGVTVESLGWGGVRVDLVDDPLAADDATLAEAWTAAMKPLSDARVFARSSVDAVGDIDFEPGARFDLDPEL